MRQGAAGESTLAYPLERSGLGERRGARHSGFDWESSLWTSSWELPTSLGTPQCLRTACRLVPGPDSSGRTSPYTCSTPSFPSQPSFCLGLCVIMFIAGISQRYVKFFLNPTGAAVRTHLAPISRIARGFLVALGTQAYEDIAPRNFVVEVGSHRFPTLILGQSHIVELWYQSSKPR